MGIGKVKTEKVLAIKCVTQDGSKKVVKTTSRTRSGVLGAIKS